MYHLSLKNPLFCVYTPISSFFLCLSFLFVHYLQVNNFFLLEANGAQHTSLETRKCRGVGGRSGAGVDGSVLIMRWVAKRRRAFLFEKRIAAFVLIGQKLVASPVTTCGRAAAWLLSIGGRRARQLRRRHHIILLSFLQQGM